MKNSSIDEDFTMPSSQRNLTARLWNNSAVVAQHPILNSAVTTDPRFSTMYSVVNILIRNKSLRFGGLITNFHTNIPQSASSRTVNLFKSGQEIVNIFSSADPSIVKSSRTGQLEKSFSVKSPEGYIRSVLRIFRFGRWKEVGIFLGENGPSQWSITVRVLHVKIHGEIVDPSNRNLRTLRRTTSFTHLSTWSNLTPSSIKQKLLICFEVQQLSTWSTWNAIESAASKSRLMIEVQRFRHLFDKMLVWTADCVERN